jgi:hypothetical protein
MVSHSPSNDIEPQIGSPGDQFFDVSVSRYA